MIGQNIQWTTSYTFPTNVWVNLIITSKNGLIKYYINGEYQSSKTVARDISKLGAIFSIGASQTNGSGWGNFFKGKINDVRIYDHALSPLEVKQISQGLILHYLLNDNGWGQKNLLAGTNQIFTSNNEFNRTLDLAPIFDSYGLVSYTISFDLKSTDVSNRNIIRVYCQNGSGTRYSISQNYINNITTEFKRYSVTVTPILEKQNLTQSYLAFYGNYNTGNKPVVKNIKVELGEKVTPWCPNEADKLYNKLGLNENIQYDTSGYCNNGIKIGTFQYESDTPKYDISTYAQGSASTHLEGIILPSEVKTVSLWIKCTKTANSAIFNDRITGLQIGLLNSLLYVNSLTSTKGFTTTHWKDNEWNHVVVINDNGTRFCYVNGQAETQSGSSNYYIHNTDKFWLWNRSYNNNYPFKGNLSDLRIYCTVLSPEDILLLYHNSAYIDNQGNIYGAIYEEV